MPERMPTETTNLDRYGNDGTLKTILLSSSRKSRAGKERFECRRISFLWNVPSLPTSGKAPVKRQGRVKARVLSDFT